VVVDQGANQCKGVWRGGDPSEGQRLLLLCAADSGVVVEKCVQSVSVLCQCVMIVYVPVGLYVCCTPEAFGLRGVSAASVKQKSEAAAAHAMWCPWLALWLQLWRSSRSSCAA